MVSGSDHSALMIHQARREPSKFLRLLFDLHVPAEAVRNFASLSAFKADPAQKAIYTKIIGIYYIFLIFYIIYLEATVAEMNVLEKEAKSLFRNKFFDARR